MGLSVEIRPRGYKTCFMLDSADDHESFSGNRYENANNTVDSRYLEFQGTLLNTSRCPYLDI